MIRFQLESSLENDQNAMLEVEARLQKKSDLLHVCLREVVRGLV